MGNFNAKCKLRDCNIKIKVIKGISKDKLNYCFMHKCSLPKCEEKRIETLLYCKYHKCANYHCEKQAYAAGYCSGCFMCKNRNN